MRNPVFNKTHLKEYFGYGALASVAFMLPVFYFLFHHKYENLYYLFIGCAFFMAVIFGYNYKLLDRPYDKKRAVSMLVASHLTILTSVFISAILIILTFLFFFPGLFSEVPGDELVKAAPANVEPRKPAGLLLMVLAVNFIGNFCVGTFVSVITTYAGKRDQTKDRPAPLETNIPPTEIKT